LDSWNVDVAVLGSDDGRFVSKKYVATAMREGGGVRVSVPLGAGWSVLRLTRQDA
jgi:hypothetical protein